MSVLRIYFSAQWRDSASVCPWALCDDSGAVLQSGSGTLASMPKAKECMGILAPERTLLVSVETPAGPRRRWLAALPFLAENHTLPDPEENHVVLAAAPVGGRVALAITDKGWVRRIVEACRAAGVPLRRAVPEVLLPGLPKSGWILVWHGDGGFVRSGASSGMALDAGDAASQPIALRLMLEQTSIVRPDKMVVRLAPGPAGADAAMPVWGDFPVPLEAGDAWDWRRAPIPAETPNLLSGELAPPSRPQEWLPRVRPAAYIAAALLLIEMVGANLQWAALSYEQRTLKSGMESSFRKAFGSEATMVAPPLQMQRLMADMKHGAGMEDDSDFFPLMNLSARALARLPAGSVRELHYEGGRLEVEVNAATAPQLDALKMALRNAGLSVHADTHAASGGFSSRLTLQLAAAS